MRNPTISSGIFNWSRRWSIGVVECFVVRLEGCREFDRAEIAVVTWCYLFEKSACLPLSGCSFAWIANGGASWQQHPPRSSIFKRDLFVFWCGPRRRRLFRACASVCCLCRDVIAFVQVSLGESFPSEHPALFLFHSFLDIIRIKVQVGKKIFTHSCYSFILLFLKNGKKNWENNSPKLDY